MEITLSLIENIAISATAIIALVTLILKIIQLSKESYAMPYRRKLEYQSQFGDFIVNQGSGVMIILDIKFFYQGKEENYDSLVKLYIDKLKKIYGNDFSVTWNTFISNEEVNEKYLNSQSEIKLIELNPLKYSSQYPYLWENLYKIREDIIIEITYKNMYGIKKTKQLGKKPEVDNS